MGANLALNLADSGNRVSVYNRTTSVTDDFMGGPAVGKEMVAAATLDEMVGQLGSPRVVLLMVKAGPAVAPSSATSVDYSRMETSSSMGATRGSPTPSADTENWQSRESDISELVSPGVRKVPATVRR